MCVYCFFAYRFRPPKVNREQLRRIIANFQVHQDYEKAYEQLVSGDWASFFFHVKSKSQQRTFKEHVRIYIAVFIILKLNFLAAPRIFFLVEDFVLLILLKLYCFYKNS